MKKVTSTLSSFEEFKLDNLKAICGGSGDDGGGGPVDPKKRPTDGTVVTGNDRP